MFKQRLLTALILIPLVLMGLLFANDGAFIGAIGLTVLAMAWEWFPLMPLNLKMMAWKGLFLLVLMAACYCLYPAFISDSWGTNIVFMGMALWLILAVFVCLYPKLQGLWGRPWIVAGLGMLLLSLYANAMVSLFKMEQGRFLVLYLLLLVWAADSGAYFVGKLWGSHTLIPAVSPKKTVEGVVGGFTSVMLVALLGFYYFEPDSHRNWFLIAVVVALVSLLGDLFISMLKRRAQVKDTGSLVPGHGGLLDRMDSMLPAALFFYAGFYFFPLEQVGA